MATTIPVKLSNLGITSDAFERTSKVRSLVHFDPVSFPDQLMPHRSTESGDSSASTNQIGVFEFGNNKLYGLSLASGTSTKLFYRSPADVSDASWDQASSASTSHQPDGLMFVDYKRVGKLFFSVPNGGLIDSYHYADSTYATDQSGIVVVAQAIVHSDDNVMYVPLANNIASNNNGSWNTAVFSNPLPTQYQVVSICEYGKMLAIGCAPVNGYGKSVIYLWDKTSVSWSEVIDLGYRNLQVLEQVEGALVAISYNTNNSFGSRITFQSYSGGEPQTFAELISTTTFTTGDLSAVKQKYGSRLYFMLTITLNGTKLQGVWRVSRSSPGQPLTVSLDYLPNGDTGLSSGTLNGFYLWGDYMFISYVSAATYGMSKTDDQANYTATSYVETIINPGLNTAEYGMKKALIKFGVNTAPLSSGQQVVAKYRVDGGSWKTIFTKTSTTPTTDPSTFTANRDASGQFDQGTYYEFRLESTGGAVITGYNWQYDLVAQQQ